MVTLNLKHCLFAAIGLASFAIVGVAYANPSVFSAGVTTNNAASSTPAYLTAGVSTSTTPVYDTNTQTSAGVAYKADSAGLLVQFTGSSTLSTLKASVEYSQDCIDYYQNYVLDARTISTSTVPYTLSTPFSTQVKFASTTLNGIGLNAPSSTVDSLALVIPTPFRCTRVVFTLTGGNGAVWGQIVPIKERP